MQTTRGTSLTDGADGALGDESTAASTTTAPGRPRVLLVLALAIAVVAIDQLTKAIAVAQLSDRGPVELFGGALNLNLAYNSGAAFSFAQGFTVVFSLIALVVSLVIIRVARQRISMWWAVALGFLLGGAVGNLVDRLFRPPGPLRGHVVDFLQLPHWPIFNLADSAIVGAGALMVFLTFRGVQLDGSRQQG